MSGTKQPNGPEDVTLRVLVPAYVTSELKTAFQIGFMVFIPFFDYRSGGSQHLDGHGDDDGVAGDAGVAF